MLRECRLAYNQALAKHVGSLTSDRTPFEQLRRCMLAPFDMICSYGLVFQSPIFLKPRSKATSRLLITVNSGAAETF